MDSIDHALLFYRDLLNATLIKEFQISKELVQQIFSVDFSSDQIPVMVFEIENQQFEILIMHQHKIQSINHVCISVDNRSEFIKQCQQYNIAVKRISKGEKNLVFIEDFIGNSFEIKEK